MFQTNFILQEMKDVWGKVSISMQYVCKFAITGIRILTICLILCELFMFKNKCNCFL